MRWLSICYLMERVPEKISAKLWEYSFSTQPTCYLWHEIAKDIQVGGLVPTEADAFPRLVKSDGFSRTSKYGTQGWIGVLTNL